MTVIVFTRIGIIIILPGFRLSNCAFLQKCIEKFWAHWILLCCFCLVWNLLPELISGGVGIRMSWVENFPKINKQGGTSIRDQRVRACLYRANLHWLPSNFVCRVTCNIFKINGFPDKCLNETYKLLSVFTFGKTFVSPCWDLDKKSFPAVSSTHLIRLQWGNAV